MEHIRYSHIGCNCFKELFINFPRASEDLVLIFYNEKTQFYHSALLEQTHNDPHHPSHHHILLSNTRMVNSFKEFCKQFFETITTNM